MSSGAFMCIKFLPLLERLGVAGVVGPPEGMSSMRHSLFGVGVYGASFCIDFH